MVVHDAEAKVVLERPKSTVFGFGIHAERFIARVPAGVALVASDDTFPEDAVAKAIALRNLGMPLATAIILDPDVVTVGRGVASQIYHECVDGPERMRRFAELATRQIKVQNYPLQNCMPRSWAKLLALRELLQLADVAVFRSMSDRNRIESFMNSSRAYNVLMPDMRIAQLMTHDESGVIVVWGPQYAAAELAIYAYSLDTIGMTAVFVCRGSIGGSAHQFIEESDFARNQIKVSLVIDANLGDPACALAFNDQRLSVIYARTSGAHEYIYGGNAYDPLSATDIASSIKYAESAKTTRTNRKIRAMHYCELREALERAVPLPKADDPIVSIILPTYNRPDELYRNLISLANQTATNIEVLCFNDAGESVEDIVADFSFARLITQKKNMGPTTAFNMGIEMSRGQYICFLPDDDRFFPNHIGGMLRALAQSALPVANANIAQQCILADEVGKLSIFGYSLHHDISFDLTDLLSNGCRIPVMGMVFEKKFFERLGPWNTALRVNNDYEYILRAGALTDFAHQNCVGGYAAIREDGSTISAGNQDLAIRESEEVLQRFTPPDRHAIIRRQAELRAAMKAAIHNIPDRPFSSVWVPLRTPIPLEEWSVI